MISAHSLQTIRTARYFTIGELSDETVYTWIVLHGYAQLAEDFIQAFEGLTSPSHFIVAPEGLNRFYAKGFGGKSAANWMTSEDRLNEIQDYIHYLDNVYTQLNLGSSKSKIIVLGFSQGVATASRWIHATRYHIGHFVVYAGEIATELQSPLSDKLKNLPVIYVTGTKDKLIASDKQQQVYELMEMLKATIITFDGGHEVLPEVVKRIEESIIEAGNKS
jgi:predicted esterase